MSRTRHLGRCVALLAVAAVLTTACAEELSSPTLPESSDAVLSMHEDGRPLMDRLTATLILGQIILDLVDADCRPAFELDDPATPLFLIPVGPAAGGICTPDLQFPVLAPDGHQVTLGEWDGAVGRVKIQCVEGGTRYQFHFRGLIPNGVYTIWHFPGTGAGALASHPPDDINNVFRADKAGVANFKTIGTPGPMTFGGAVGECTLPYEPQVGQFANELFVVVYHTDNRAWGPFPGPAGTTVSHLVFLVE